jgi:LysM repeat protein
MAAHDTPHQPIDRARTVFAGLRPTVSTEAPAGRPRIPRALMATGTIVLASSMALGLTGQVDPVAAAGKRPADKPKTPSALGKTIRDAVSAARTAITGATGDQVAESVPSMYRVAAGDTVSSIAGRFGLSTASVLALNGLGWTTLIFPGQELKLGGATSPIPAPAEAMADRSGRYTIVSGDTISGIADRFGVSTQSVLSANGLGWSSIIYPGQSIVVPGIVDFTEAISLPIEGPADPVGEAVVEQPVVEPVPPPAPEPVVPPAAEAPPAPANGSYTITSGDTLSGIAMKFGITTEALLGANGLDWSSVIYTGHTLVIPGVSTPVVSTAGSVEGLTEEMAQNASIIIAVGRELGVSDYGIVIALATAAQESTLRNLDWGDRDSVGLFQQRPSSGWGSIEQLTDPYYAARLFYGGPYNPNAGWTRGLLDISGWESLPLTVAAQSVQISAYPDAYAKWESSAWAWLSALG